MSTLTKDLLDEITTLAKKNGALEIGLTKIRRVEPVIVLAFPFTDDAVHHILPPVNLLGKEYLASKHVQDLIAKTLQREGFRAEYKTMLSVFGDFRPLAVSAGLGDWGRNGLVVNKKYGSGMVFASIFTDAPFEIAESLEPARLNVSDHCSACGHCVDACPAKAFQDNTFSMTKCSPRAALGCGECLKVCGSKS